MFRPGLWRLCASLALSFNGSNVTVIDGRNSNSVALPIGGPAFFPAVDTVTNKVYVANSGNLDVIDGMTNAIANVTLSAGVGAIAVNSVTNRVYVAGQNQVTVISGAK
jgi:hypothetical protein